MLFDQTHIFCGTCFYCSIHVKQLILRFCVFLQYGKLVYLQFSVPRIEYLLGGSSKKGSYVYFLLQVFCVILLFCHKCCSDATMVTQCHNSTI